MFKYSLLIQKIYSEDFGMKDTYGILILNENNEEFYRLSDVFSEKEYIQNFIDKCNEYQIHPVYIFSLIEQLSIENIKMENLIKQISLTQSENLKKSMMKIITCS